jgi:hypothetical protein
MLGATGEEYLSASYHAIPDLPPGIERAAAFGILLALSHLVG